VGEQTKFSSPQGISQVESAYSEELRAGGKASSRLLSTERWNLCGTVRDSRKAESVIKSASRGGQCCKGGVGTGTKKGVHSDSLEKADKKKVCLHMKSIHNEG